MAALTSAGHPCGRSVQADLLHSHVSSFPDLLSPTTPAGSLRASVIARVGCRARARQTSPVPSRLVADAVAESCSFVIMVDLVLIRCFPPRLAATQLLRVLASTTAAGGRGIPPRKRTLLSSALGWICKLSGQVTNLSHSIRRKVWAGREIRSRGGRGRDDHSSDYSIFNRMGGLPRRDVPG